MTHIWQTKQFQQLWQAKNENRLAHALLLVGMKGTNKAKFADCFSRAFFCDRVTRDGESCGKCRSCRLTEGRAHPNVLWIEPEKEGAIIKVDQVREVNDFVNQTSLQGEYRIVIIHPADDMNINAANALLKTLEEPASGSLLILISDQNGSLPATVLSRCQRVVFPPPHSEETLAWLTSHPSRQNLFQAMIHLLEGKCDPVKSAAELQNNDPLQMLDFLLTWVVDVLRLQLNSDSDRVINKDYAQHLIQLGQKTQLKKNVKLMEYIQHLRAQLCEGINFNKQMMLESILIRWMECA
jgi:DNA polymerase-3 subunit delta'